MCGSRGIPRGILKGSCLPEGHSSVEGKGNYSTDTKEGTENKILRHRYGYPKMEILRATKEKYVKEETERNRDARQDHSDMDVESH